MKRTSIYVDGFNLYYRALKKTPYKWLDLKSLFEKLLSSENEIQSINYFTAIVSGKKDPQQPIRQKVYINALEKHTPEVKVHYGQFLSHPARAPLVKPMGKNRFANIIKTEEKGSDVNLAVHFLNDAWLDKYDCAILVSNDSDIAESIKLVKEHHKKLIGLLLPENCSPSKELIKHAHFIKTIRKGALASSQLPNPIPKTTIHKPENW